MAPRFHLFISYRRTDSGETVGRIYDLLELRYSRSTVFRDVDSIPMGVDFRDHLKMRLQDCTAALVIIGPRWLTETDERGVRRIDNRQDHVRLELEHLLNRNIPVIPVLVQGARLPAGDELPRDVRGLAFRHATALRPDPDFRRDLEKIIAAIGPPTRGWMRLPELPRINGLFEKGTVRIRVAAVATLAVLSFAGLALFVDRPPPPPPPTTTTTTQKPQPPPRSSREAFAPGTRPLETMLVEGGPAVLDLAINATGDLAAVASRDGRVQLWKLPDGKKFGKPLVHEEGVESIDFSPDGHTLVSGGWNGTVRLWEVQTQRTLKLLTTGATAPVTTVAFSPDGQRVATASGAGDAKLRLWSVPDGRLLEVLDDQNKTRSGVKSIAFSPDGESLAQGSTAEPIVIWKNSSPTRLNPPSSTLASTRSPQVESLTFNPEGTILVTGDREGSIRFWSATDGKPQTTLMAHVRAVESLAFSPDGTVLASASEDASVLLWSFPDREPLQPLTGHHDTVKAVAFGPDGQTILSGSADGTVRIWRGEPGPEAAASRTP